MKGRVTKCKWSAVRVIASGQGQLGGGEREGADSFGCAVPVQNRGVVGAWWLYRLKAGQSGTDGFGWTRFHTIYRAHISFYFRCSQVSKHLLSTFYVQGMLWVLGEGCGERGK